MKFTLTVEEMRQKVLIYFRDCEEVRLVFPDEAGMLNYLDIEDEEYEKMKETAGYDKIIRWARRRRTSWLERELVKGKNSAGCMNALKQEKNGGYSEKPQEKKERKIIVKLEGVKEIGGTK